MVARGGRMGHGDRFGALNRRRRALPDATKGGDWLPPFANFKCLVPKRGLEPPLPCENVDLNHARLPIPPFRLTIRGPSCLQPRELREVLVSQSEGALSMVAAFPTLCA